MVADRSWQCAQLSLLGDSITRFEALCSEHGTQVIHSRNAYLSFTDIDQDAWKDGLRRTNSDPMLLTWAQLDFDDDEVSAEVDQIVSWSPSKPQIDFDGATEITTAESSRSCSRSSSPLSIASFREDLILGPDRDVSGLGWAWSPEQGWQNVALDHGSSMVRLTDFTALPKRPGTERRLSMGSLNHHLLGTKCKVCAFEGRPGRECRQGPLCSHCHCEHAPYVRPARPQRGSKRWRRGMSEQQVNDE